MLDHRQENLASAWPDTAESRYAFSPLPAPSKDKRSFRPKGTCPHWLQVTLIQLLGCTALGQEAKPFLAGLQATAIWRGRNNSAVKELINQAESCLAALDFPSAICYIFLHLSSYLAEHDGSKASEVPHPCSPSHPAVDKAGMQNQSFQSNTERNNSKFVSHSRFIYLFICLQGATCLTRQRKTRRWLRWPLPSKLCCITK